MVVRVTNLIARGGLGFGTAPSCFPGLESGGLEPPSVRVTNPTAFPLSYDPVAYLYYGIILANSG